MESWVVGTGECKQQKITSWMLFRCEPFFEMQLRCYCIRDMTRHDPLSK